MAMSYDWADVRPCYNWTRSTTKNWGKAGRAGCHDREDHSGIVYGYSSWNYVEGNGNSCALVQEKLNIAMFKARNSGQSTPYPGDIAQDGIFGNQTDTVTRWFQARNGLNDDGIVGGITWGVLKNA